MKKLYDEIRKLEGNVLCIEIRDDKIMSKLNKNNKISIYELYRNEKKGIFKRRKRIKTKGGKSVNIKKFRKIFKKKSIEYIIINIDNIYDYYKFLVSNSIYVCNTKVMVFGSSKYIDDNVIASKFKRYNVEITNYKEDDKYLCVIDVSKAKFSKIKEKFYIIIDTFINIGDMISYILTS